MVGVEGEGRGVLLGERVGPGVGRLGGGGLSVDHARLKGLRVWFRAV